MVSPDRDGNDDGEKNDVSSYVFLVLSNVYTFRPFFGNYLFSFENYEQGKKKEIK
jgi:hypothetical protein